MSDQLTNKPPRSLIGILGDKLQGDTFEFVYTLRLPCAVGVLPKDASEVVIEARSYLHGADNNLICSLDHRVVTIVRDIIRDKAPKHLLYMEEIHLSVALMDPTAKCVILLGGMDSRFMIQGESKSSLSTTGAAILQEFKRMVTDRTEVSLLDLDKLTEILQKDLDAFEKALCLQPI